MIEPDSLYRVHDRRILERYDPRIRNKESEIQEPPDIFGSAREAMEDPSKDRNSRVYIRAFGHPAGIPANRFFDRRHSFFHRLPRMDHDRQISPDGDLD